MNSENLEFLSFSHKIRKQRRIYGRPYAPDNVKPVMNMDREVLIVTTVIRQKRDVEFSEVPLSSRFITVLSLQAIK